MPKPKPPLFHEYTAKSKVMETSSMPNLAGFVHKVGRVKPPPARLNAAVPVPKASMSDTHSRSTNGSSVPTPCPPVKARPPPPHAPS